MPSSQVSKIYKIISLIACSFLAIFCFGKSVWAGEATTTVYINEICPNPENSDDGNEWIEIFNSGDTNINLSGWELSYGKDEASKKFFMFGDIILSPNSTSSYYILRGMPRGFLNNSGGIAELYQPDRKLLMNTGYDGAASGNEYCWAQDADKTFKWTKKCTEGAVNEIIPITTPPNDGSTGGGGGGGGSSSSSYSGDSGGYVGYIVDPKPNLTSGFEDRVLITEILPNPLGIDDGEWIEIYNTSTDDFVLNNWKLRDNQNEYLINNIKLPAKTFLLFPKSETKLTLNNGGDFVELIDWDKKVVARAEYKTAAPENQSYNLCYGKWLWLENKTPGASTVCPPPNKLPVAFFEPTTEDFSIGGEVLLDANESFDEDGQIMKYTWQFAKEVEEIDHWRKEKIFETIIPAFKFKFLSGGKQKITLTITDDLGGEDKFSLEVSVAGEEEKTSEANKNNQTTNKKSTGYFAPVDLENVREMEKGIKILVTGVVAVEPGILGADQFYLAGSGIQVYFSKKEFPILAVGDKIQVAGTLATYYNETRLKIANQNDIKILSQNNEAPIPHKIGLDEVGEEYEGSLVTVVGDITEIKGSYLWLDDGSGEARAYLKKTTNIDLNKLDLKVGDHLTLTGIVSETTAGYRILPRYESDFRVGKTLGTATKREAKSRWPYYVFPALLAVVLVIGGILWKNKRDKQKHDEEIVKF
ncbi:MAG: lamin tail domain-containing protein [Patescibacteria group bacterium]|nr:lamin tail domain-containing protein [Patescibacteria group bacterium]